MQVALEKELRLQIQMLAAKADVSMKDWILDNILSIHRRGGLGAYLRESFGSLIVLAPPTNAERFNIRIDDPLMEQAIDDLASLAQRTKPQIVYTLISCLVNEKFGVLEGGESKPSRSLIA